MVSEFRASLFRALAIPSAPSRTVPWHSLPRTPGRCDRTFTVNYGVRYDVELTDTIAPIRFPDPLTGIQMSAADFLAAQDSSGYSAGIPARHEQLCASSRSGLGHSTMTARRWSAQLSGFFYDHPLLAIAFNSDIADAAQQQQYTNVLPGLPDTDSFIQRGPDLPGNRLLGCHYQSVLRGLAGWVHHSRRGQDCSIPARSFAL